MTKQLRGAFLIMTTLWFCGACTRDTPWTLADALPTYASTTCSPPAPNQAKLLELAVNAIELTQDRYSNWLDSGAKRYLAAEDCTPTDLLRRVAAALNARGGLGNTRHVEYEIQLAWRLPDPTPAIVDSVADTAFNEKQQESDIFPRQDIRPYARTVLASFGVRAEKYGEVAYKEISLDTSLGTGAAQVAAATGYPGALPKIEQLMNDALSKFSPDDPIPPSVWKRLYEMTWALVYAGPTGKKFTAPIHEIMHRKISAGAPPFGLLTLSPTMFCHTLTYIEGQDASKPYAFCANERTPNSLIERNGT